MKLSIIIPVYNEEKTIAEVIKKLIFVKLPIEKEIIIVDDGSNDGTRERIKLVLSKTRNSTVPGKVEGNCESRIKKATKTLIKVITHNHNLGKGAAVRSGIKAATGDYILIQDADLEYNPKEIPKLLTHILSKPTTHNPQLTTLIAVYGSRFMKKGFKISKLYYLGNKFLTLFTNLLYGKKLTDMETGYKLLPASFLKKIKLDGNRFEIEPEITAKLIKNKISILEVPISYKGRTHLAGKKLTFKDAFSAIRTLIYYRLLAK